VLVLLDRDRESRNVVEGDVVAARATTGGDDGDRERGGAAETRAAGIVDSMRRWKPAGSAPCPRCQRHRKDCEIARLGHGVNRVRQRDVLSIRSAGSRGAACRASRG
jgi:hypothetical protein